MGGVLNPTKDSHDSISIINYVQIIKAIHVVTFYYTNYDLRTTKLRFKVTRCSWWDTSGQNCPGILPHEDEAKATVNG